MPVLRSPVNYFYCHYMAFRLGAFNNERIFQRIEQLLLVAEKLDGWCNESASLSNGDYGTFWALIWQLQVAEHFCKQGATVRWMGNGPDLRVDNDDGCMFVECYTFRKSFDKICFLQDLLTALDSQGRLRITYDLCLPMSLQPEQFDHLMQPFVDETAIVRFESDAEQRYPVIVSQLEETSIAVLFEGNDVSAYDPSVFPKSVGSPALYFGVALKEMLNAKKGSNNSLSQHRPNRVFVNALLSADFQFSNSSQQVTEPYEVTLPAEIDAVSLTILGIDEELSEEKMVVIKSASQ
jgi:hypothetical protein